MKKTLILTIITALLIIIIAPNVNAGLTTDIWAYFSNDNANVSGTTSIDISNSTFQNNATISGATTGAGGKLNEAFMYDGTNDYAETTATLDFHQDNSFCLWVNVSEDGNPIAGADKDATWRLQLAYGDPDGGGAITGTANRFECVLYDNAGNQYAVDTQNSALNTYFHACCIVDLNNKLMLYVDGVSRTNTSIGTEVTQRLREFSYGAVMGYFFNGTIDEVMVWNRTITQTEILTLYNGGAGYNPFTGAGGGTPDYFRINLTDEDDATSINDFIAIVNGTTYGTNNGSITTNILNNVSADVDINISSNYTGGYFNKSLSYNVSTDYISTLYQTITTITANEKITNNTLTGVYFRNGTEINITSQHFKAGNYTFKFSNTSYFNKSLNYSLPALFNGTINITEVYNTELNIYIRNAYSNQSLSNFSGWIYNQANLYNITHNATPGNTSQTGLIQGLNYTIYTEHPHYSIGPDNYENISINDTSYNLTFYLYSNNSIVIYIRDETSNNLITDNITITITYNTSENQSTTINGTYFFEGLKDGNYTLKFSGTNYTTKSYAVTLADRSTQILTAYLSMSYQSVIFTIRNSLTNAVIEGASFTMSRLINSTWTTTESKTSDITGRVQVSYLPAVKYKFTISASNYTSKVFYLDPVIFDSYNVNLDPVISIELTQDYGEVNIVYYPKVFYDNKTNNFVWLITSPKGALTDYSINITYPGGAQNRSGVNAIGEQFDINFNISGATLYDKVNITYTYDTTLSNLKTFRISYGILGVATGNNTIEQIRNEKYGMGLFETLLISILAVLILAGFTFMLAGPGAGLFVGMLVYGFFVYIGFLPLWSILITLLVGFVLVVKLSSDV